MNKFVDFLGDHWLKIVISIIVVFVVLGIAKIIAKIADCQTPICKGFKDIFGDGVTLVDQILSGCIKQANCKIQQDEKSCDAANGCDWYGKEGYSNFDNSNSPPSPPSAGCLNSTGYTPGSGGIVSTRCLLFMGPIGALAAMLVLSLTKWFLESRMASKRLNQLKDLTGETAEKILKAIRPEVESTVDKANDILKEGGKPPMNPDIERVAAKGISEAKAAEFLKKLADLSAPDAQAVMANAMEAAQTYIKNTGDKSKGGDPDVEDAVREASGVEPPP